jgi:hypothetical protein
VHHEHTHAVEGLVRTFWTLGDFSCVLVRQASGLSVQVFIGDRAFLTEPSKDQIEAIEQAEVLFAVFSDANSTLQRS